MDKITNLILVRHGRSEWNDKGLWTGLTDVSLNDVGKAEAAKAAESIKDLKIDLIFDSKLKRVKETMDIITRKLRLKVPVRENAALNERDYGIYTGQNKWQVEKELGQEEFKKLRRSWDYPIPKGESLKMVYERVMPFYKNEILPVIKRGKNILIGGSGNSLRALVKYLENIPDDKISELEINTGEVFVYKMGREGKMVSKEIRSKNLKTV